MFSKRSRKDTATTLWFSGKQRRNKPSKEIHYGQVQYSSKDRVAKSGTQLLYTPQVQECKLTSPVQVPTYMGDQGRGRCELETCVPLLA